MGLSNQNGSFLTRSVLRARTPPRSLVYSHPVDDQYFIKILIDGKRRAAVAWKLMYACYAHGSLIIATFSTDLACSICVVLSGSDRQVGCDLPIGWLSLLSSSDCPDFIVSHWRRVKKSLTLTTVAWNTVLSLSFEMAACYQSTLVLYQLFASTEVGRWSDKVAGGVRLPTMRDYY